MYPIYRKALNAHRLKEAIRLFCVIAILSISGTDCMAAPSEEGSSPTRRVGVFLWHESPNDLMALQGIREAFKEAGVAHELIVRQANSDERVAEKILDEFQSKSLDLIFAMGTKAAKLANEQVKDIPVVFTAVTNPVESGVVPSWEGSESHLAGNSNWIRPEILVRVFRLAVPRLDRLGMLRSSGTGGLVSGAELRGMREFLARPGSPKLDIIEEIAEGVEDIRPAVRRLLDAQVQAIWIPIDFLVYSNMEEVLQGMGDDMLPLVSSSMKGTEAGAVAGVLVDYAILGKRAVVIALEILQKGRTPSSLPIETMESYQVVVNLGAAKRCGYELPLSLLVLADLILTEDGELRENEDGE